MIYEFFVCQLIFRCHPDDRREEGSRQHKQRNSKPMENVSECPQDPFITLRSILDDKKRMKTHNSIRTLWDSVYSVVIKLHPDGNS